MKASLFYWIYNYLKGTIPGKMLDFDDIQAQPDCNNRQMD